MESTSVIWVSRQCVLTDSALIGLLAAWRASPFGGCQAQSFHDLAKSVGNNLVPDSIRVSVDRDHSISRRELSSGQIVQDIDHDCSAFACKHRSEFFVNASEFFRIFAEGPVQVGCTIRKQDHYQRDTVVMGDFVKPEERVA